MPLTVSELSSMVGANTETVGRLLDRYESDGLVRRLGKNWVVPDKGALTRALEYASAES
jgi:CRP-like cAMP-binding protein